MSRSPAGCWTCKLRHRKCDFRTPECRECRDRCIPCHGYGPKPVWMDGSAAERQQLTLIKTAVKRHVSSVRRSRDLHRQATRTTAPPVARASPTRTRTPDDGNSTSSAHEPPSSSKPGDRAEDDRSIVERNLTPGHSHAPRRSTSSHVLRPDSASLVMHYLDQVFYWLFPYFRPRSRLGDRGWLLPLLCNGGPMSHAAMALSALHRNAVQVTRRQDYLRNQEALEYHSRALRELLEISCRTDTETLLGDKFQLAEFIASSLTLISFEVFNGAEYDWLPHLEAVTTVLSMQSPDVLLGRPPSPISAGTPPAGRGYDPSGEESQPDFDFLVTQAIWFDILSCVSTGRVPRLPYKHWLEVSKLEMADLMGCYNWVMIAIGDLAHLQAWKGTMKEQGTLSVPELVMRSRGIETRLRDGLAELESAIKEDGDVSPAAWVSHVFVLASLVLSSTIVSGPLISLPEIRETVQRAVETLHIWPEAISLQSLVWPLYIMGCMAEAQHRDFFDSLLTDSINKSGGFGNCGTVLKIMKESWASKERHDWDGLDLTFQTGVRVLLI